MTLLASRSLGGFIVAGLLMVGACKSSNPTKEEMDRSIDARLAERGLAPLPSVSGSSSGSTASSAPPSASAKNANDDPAAASLAFLVRLDELMKDYAPQLPAVDNKSDVLRCVTSDAAKSPDLQKVASALKQQTEAAKQERKRKESEFFSSLYPLAFHYDLDWQTRKGAAIPPTHGCGESEGKIDNIMWLEGIDANDCRSHAPNWTWRLRTSGRPPWFTYTGSETPPTQPPELMRRMAAANINAPPRFSCRVDDVVTEKDRKEIKCVSSGTVTSLRVSGDLKAVNAGDLVSVPLAATKHDPDGVLFKNVAVKNGGWVVDVDGVSLTVDAAATCPSMEEILATLGKPSAK